jgi:hypothetical protein
MVRSIPVSVLAAGLVALTGSAAAQGTPPPALTVAPPPAVAPLPVPAVESSPKASNLTDLGALSLTLGAFTGTTVLACGFTLGAGSVREACQGTLGGLSLALIAASIPFFVLGTRTQRTTTWITDRVTFTASPQRGTVIWTSTF